MYVNISESVIQCKLACCGGDMFSKNVGSSHAVISCLPFIGKFSLNLESMSPFVFIKAILKAYKCHDLFISKGTQLPIQLCHDTQLIIPSASLRDSARYIYSVRQPASS